MRRGNNNGATLPRVRSVARAVAILRAFSQERSKLALKDIVKATALDPGTSRRILVTLKEEGIVFQDPSNGLYSLSTGLRELGQAVVIELPLAQVLQEKLQSLAELTQTTVYLSAIRKGQVICLSRNNGGQPIEVRWWNVGEARPYNRGAGPRILFAHLPGSIQNTVLAEIENSDSESAKLAADSRFIHENGFVIMHDEIAVGISAMAVPLTNYNGEVIAAISTGGLTPNYIGAAQVKMLERLQAAVKEMRPLVGHQGNKSQ